MREKSTTRKETPQSPSNPTLPPIDATPEEIAEALFRLKPQGETEKPAALRCA